MTRAGSRRLAVSLAIFAAMVGVLASVRVSLPVVEAHPAPPSKAPHTLIAKQFNGSRATQELVALGDEIEAVDLELATYKRAGRGRLLVRVSKRQRAVWQILGSKQVYKSQLQDNAYHRFGFDPPLPVARGDTLAISLTVLGSARTAISWYETPTWSLPGHRLLLNNRLRPGTAHFRIQYRPLRGSLAGPMFAHVWRRAMGFWPTAGAILFSLAAALAMLVLIHLSLWSAPEPATADRQRASGPLSYARPRLARAAKDASVQLRTWASQGHSVWRERWLIRSALPMSRAEQSIHSDLALVFLLALGVRFVWAALIPPAAAADEFARLGYGALATRLLTVRIVSALLGALSCCFGYLFAHALTRERSWARALGVSMTLAPGSALLGAGLTHVVLLCVSVSALCWLMVRMRQGPEIREARQSLTRRLGWLGGGIGAGAAVVILNLASGAQHWRAGSADSQLRLVELGQALGQSFQALFIWPGVVQSAPVSLTSLLLVCAAVVGTGLRLWRSEEGRPASLLLGLLLFHALVSFLLSGSAALVPMLAPILFVLLSGLGYWFRDHPWFYRLAPLPILALQVVSLVRVLGAYFAVQGK